MASTNIYENQALVISPKYFNSTHKFPLDRFDIILQFIINYITSTGLHGSCWMQVQHAINQIIKHQNMVNDSDIIDTLSNTHKTKNLQSQSAKKAKDLDKYSLCSFWHSFHEKKSNNHYHTSIKPTDLSAFILHQFITYLRDIFDKSDNPLPFVFYIIDPIIKNR